MCTVKSKKCTKCGQDKTLTEFYKRNASKDGLHSDCKSCAKERVNKYLEANKEARKEYGKKYYEANKEARKEYGKKYYEANKEAVKKYREANKEDIKEYKKKYREANKEDIKEYKKRYRDANKEAIKEINRRYREANKEDIKEYKKRYREANKEAIKEINRRYREANKEYFNRYHKERYANDPKYRTSCLLRRQTQRLGDFKNTATIELVGCSPAEFWLMNGSPSIEELQELHIDHIVPLSWFNLENEDHLKVSNHYVNLQYLNSEDNISKGDRYAGRPDNILGYKGEFDVDGYVADILEKIKDLNLDNLK